MLLVWGIVEPAVVTDVSPAMDPGEIGPLLDDAGVRAGQLVTRLDLWRRASEQHRRSL